MALTDIVALQMVHVLFATIWVGGSVLLDLSIIPVWKTISTIRELKIFNALAKRISPVFAISSLGTLISGALYFPRLYGHDAGVAFSTPRGTLVGISLALVIISFVVAGALINRNLMALMKMDLPDDDDAAIPDDIMGRLKQAELGSHLNGIMVVAVLLLMIVASNGGF